MKLRTCAAALLGLSFFMPRLLQADQQADDLNERYKVALAKGDVDLAVGFICDAAKLDPKKYDKKCAAAQHHENELLQSFDAAFGAGQGFMQQRDYANAIKQFSKITFGPHHDDALHQEQEAKNAENRPQVLAGEREALAAAQAAYDRGDLAAAQAGASTVKLAELLPFSQQILTNIRVYTEAVQAGDSLMQGGKYPAAQQKYKFAYAVRPNGPGDVAAKLQKLEGLITQPATQTAATTTTGNPTNKNPPTVVTNNPPPPPPPINSTDPVKIKAALADGRSAESRKDFEAALQAYERILLLNPRQADAIIGKQRVMSSIQKSPQGAEATLTIGVHSFYRSQLAEAGDAIALYLTSGDARNKGAAYFYLGATYATEAIFANPHQTPDNKALQQHAMVEFQRARCEHYNPIERYISPKIIALWNKSAC